MIRVGLVLAQTLPLVVKPQSAAVHQVAKELGSASPSDAAEIVAEMVREAEEQVEAHEALSASRDEQLIAARYHGKADALREAERRIRAKNHGMKFVPSAVLHTVRG